MEKLTSAAARFGGIVGGGRGSRLAELFDERLTSTDSCPGADSGDGQIELMKWWDRVDKVNEQSHKRRLPKRFILYIAVILSGRAISE